MNAVIDFLNSAGTWFIAFALPMVIQSSVLILLILGIDLLVRKKVRAVFRYGLWMLVLIKLMLPTSLSSPTGLGYWFAVPTPEIPQRTVPANAHPQEFPSIPFVSPVESAIQNPIEPIVYPTELTESPIPMTPNPMAVEENEPLATATAIGPSPVISWQGIVLLVWLVIVLILFLLLSQRVFFVRGLVAQAQDAKGAVVSVLHQCRGKMGISKEIPIKFSANATSPSVCGLWKPVILFPHHLVKQLSRTELESVLLHELAHIKRRDLWVNLWQTILQILYFYHPLLWLANVLIRRVREQAVDEAVLVAMQREAEEYSNTLVRVFRMSLQRPALSLRLIGVVESKKSLATRIKHILNRPIPKKAKLGVLGMLMVFVVGVILIPMAQADKIQASSNPIEIEIVPDTLKAGSLPKKVYLKDLLESAPVSTKYAELEIFEKVPNMGGEYRIRSDVIRKQLPSGKDNMLFPAGEIFYLPKKNSFYIQWDPAGASTLHYYGPFQGNPDEIEIMPAKGQANVQVHLKSIKQVWNQDDDPAFKVTIRNNGTRELKTSLLASLALEIDGKPYAPRAWWRLGTIGVMPFGPGKEYSLDIKLSQFAADRKAANELPPGLHTVKAVLLNNNSEDGRGLTTSLSRYKEMALAFSDPVEISIILAESKWGTPTNGLRAAVEFIPEKASYTQGESVAVRLHIQNVSDSDIEFKSVSTRQDYAQVKDKDGNEVQVQRRFHSGTVYTRSHTIKPTDVLVLKTTGLGFAELEDQTLDEFKSNKDYYVGSILRSKPGEYAIHYNVNRDLKTGVRDVSIVEKPQIAAKQITMKQAVETLAHKYRARLCFEDITDMIIADIALQPYRLTGNFKAQTIPPLLDQLTQSGPFTWVKYNDTYVIYPRNNSLLESPVSINISGPLEYVARKVLDKIPAGKEIEIKSPADSVVPNANKKKNIQHLWISSSPARYALSRAVEESGRGDMEIVWTLTQEQDRNRLTFHYLPRRQNSNEPKGSTPAETSAEVSTGVERKDSSGSAQFIKTSMASTDAAPAKETAAHSGRIRGVVLSAVDRKPVADAYVGVGDFWDSGGSNHSRHRENGLYAKTRTDARGRFEIDGLIHSDSHAFFVTHPDYIRHDQKAKVSANDPVGELEILLQPAAKIHATVVGENGSALPGLWLLRLEALDGHRFLAPGGDPHLSAFANSVWMQGPMSRRAQMYSSEFTFTALTPGEYRLDVVQFRLKKIISNRTDRYAMPWDPTGFAFHGGIAKITALSGQTAQVQIKPQHYGTTLQVKMPVVANQQEFPEIKKIPALISLSRNPGLPVWDSDLVYSLEDSRLGRIQEEALFFTMAGGADSITVRNLPPGVYTIFAGPAMFMNAVKVELTANQTLAAQPPPIQIQKKAGRVNTGQLRRRIRMDLSEYTLQDLCRLCTERTQSRPRITVDPALAEQKIPIASGSYEIWDLLEQLYVERKCKITEADKEKQTLVIQSTP